jgi:hypothetical protein
MGYVVMDGDEIIGQGVSRRQAIDDASKKMKVPIDFPITSTRVVEELIENGDLELVEKAS